ncbi:calcium-binding protein [Kribbella sp. NBC_01505]|uniref:calcium-binding protein n=1 Tax=Kribbella sp. NBC_01505 TaxID=2903580 RepID=UPI00387050B6
MLSTAAAGVMIALAIQPMATGAPAPLKVKLDEGLLTVVGGPEDDHPTVYVTNFPADRAPRLLVEEIGRVFITGGACVSIGVGSRVECPLKDVSKVLVDTGDGNDSINHRTEFPARLLAGAGSDTVNGSSASEFIDLGSGDDVVQPLGGTDDVHGGAGIDRVVYGGSADVEVRLDDLANDGAAGENDNIHSDVEDLTGSHGNDVLVGTAGPNRIDGGSGNDKLLSLEGDDIVIGGGGADFMSGGPGIDSAQYRERYTPLKISLDDIANDGIPGENDNVRTDVENLIGGVAADVLVGSDSPNDLDGSSGNDQIEGLAADDVLRGGPGDDLLLGDTGFDVALGGAGIDTCKAEKQDSCP